MALSSLYVQIRTSTSGWFCMSHGILASTVTDRDELRDRKSHVMDPPIPVSSSAPRKPVPKNKSQDEPDCGSVWVIRQMR